ncbi:DUF6932 family protein [Kriegella aquimaris]|uniref:Uncharacterized protein n=1 Tax=Kriegella aquimaris TaxID=192904 RepID=A0A1G9IH12_9FLAO|nr:hypothetical protein [Kriegella aquimaris]SDL24346.1 hypothetical protein SAMN04488514_101132 [Kriegella aquimaris]
MEWEKCQLFAKNLVYLKHNYIFVYIITQLIRRLIPEFTSNGLLPQGIHWATLDDIKEKLSFSTKRRTLIAGLELALKSFKIAGCEKMYIDGSFVTSKNEPSDIDACWDISNVDPTKLDPILLIFSNRRALQKMKYGCEFFPSSEIAMPPNTRYLDFFQKTKDDEKKGIVGIKLQEL